MFPCPYISGCDGSDRGWSSGLCCSSDREFLGRVLWVEMYDLLEEFENYIIGGDDHPDHPHAFRTSGAKLTDLKKILTQRDRWMQASHFG